MFRLHEISAMQSSDPTPWFNCLLRTLSHRAVAAQILLHTQFHITNLIGDTMYPIGQLFYRILVTVVLVLMVAVVAVPIDGAAAQGSAPASDDFNRCSPNTSIWQFENPANISGASPVISGQFTGDSLLRMTVPAGQTITFSGRGQNAPRIMQAVADQDFEVEARFAAPIISTTESYKIMGILVRDATNASQPKFMRFDFNSKNSALYSYLGYINAAGATNPHRKR
jgi:hypothetical protein